MNQTPRIYRYNLKPYKIKDNPFSVTTSYNASENIVGKGENAGHQHFLLFPQCFLTLERNYLTIWAEFDPLSINAFQC